MIFICFVNLNLLIGIINVFLLKIKTNNACAKKGYQDCFPYGKQLRALPKNQRMLFIYFCKFLQLKHH